jgi:hypothetical protein
MVRFALSFAKHFTARNAARSSRQLMCMVLSSGLHEEPPNLTPRSSAGGSELLLNDSVDRGGQRRPKMVERPLHSVERSEPGSSQLLLHH